MRRDSKTAGHPVDPHLLEQLQEAWLHGVFLRALRTSVVSTAAASSLMLAACGSGETPAARGPDGDAGMQTVLIRDRIPALDSATTCTNDEWQLVHGLDLLRPVDYLADSNGNLVVSELGTACKGMPSDSLCSNDLRTTALGSRHLVTTEGGVVRFWEQPAVTGLVGAIDRPEEAIWMAQASGYSIKCDVGIDLSSGHALIGFAQRGSEFCSLPGWQGKIQLDANGKITELEGMETSPTCVNGRRPEGLCSTHRGTTRSVLGEHFAAMAHLEAASVPAFAVISRELRAYGAPSSLVAAAMRAHDDEVAHARMVTRLAKRFEARAVTPRVKRMPLRDLQAFALDNAIEGCVHETYAALEASHQAQHATDPMIRNVMTRIAADERRHALLSWQLASWLETQLPKSAMHTVRAGQERAIDALGKHLHKPIERELSEVAGVPDAKTAVALHESLARDLWA